MCDIYCITCVVPVSQGLIDGPGEEYVKEEPLDNYQSNDPAGETEPVEMVLDEGGGWADLHRVRVVGRVFEQAIVWVEDLSRQEKEELPRRTTIVQTACSVMKGEREVMHIHIQIKCTHTSEYSFWTHAVIPFITQHIVIV